MKIITWNSNGWKEPGIAQMLSNEVPVPDILCLQESGDPFKYDQRLPPDNGYGVQVRTANHEVVTYRAYYWRNEIQQAKLSLITYVREIHTVNQDAFVMVAYEYQNQNFQNQRPILVLDITLVNGIRLLIGNAHGPSNNALIPGAGHHNIAAAFINIGVTYLLNSVLNNIVLNHLILIGDFNITEAQYRERYVDGNGYIFHIPPPPEPSGRQGQIDYMITSAEIVGVEDCHYNGVNFGSDHYPVIYTL